MVLAVPKGLAFMDNPEGLRALKPKAYRRSPFP